MPKSAFNRPIGFRVNGKTVESQGDGPTALIYFLRNTLHLNGPKYGCGLGECGACAVLVDGMVARSCVLALETVEGREVTTLEGLGGSGALGAVQRAFIKEQAAQCGYCLNGMILTAHAFLTANADPTETEIARAMRFNLCRCGTHVEIIRAVKTAAATLRATA